MECSGGKIMKIFTLILALSFANRTFAQAPRVPGEAFSDTVSSLNQLTPETKEDGEKLQTVEEQQDAQERIYWENKRREDKEWSRDKQINDYRYDVPGP